MRVRAAATHSDRDVLTEEESQAQRKILNQLIMNGL